MYVPVSVDEHFLLMIPVSHGTTPTTPQRHLFDWILDTWYISFPINSTYEVSWYILTQLLQVRGTRCTVVMQAVDRSVSCLTVSRRLQYNSSSCSCFCAYSVLAWRFNWLPRCQRLGTRATYTRRVSHQRVCTRFTPLPQKAAPYMTYNRSHIS